MEKIHAAESADSRTHSEPADPWTHSGPQIGYCRPPAREEPPAAGDIDGWELVGSFAYTADNVHRWFWALRRRAEG